MSNDICFMLAMLAGDQLLYVALKVQRAMIGDDVVDYPMEPENKKRLYDLLPQHIQEIGRIVAVERIFDVHIAEG